MDRIKTYQKAIIDIFQDVSEYYKGTTNPRAVRILADRENHHYQLLMYGWEGDDYTFQTLFHLDIIDEKIWIQWNSTAVPVEEELLKAGIPASNIVLGVKHPSYREFTDFALA